jgi:mono/diheme cytochrome c family protein
MKAVFKTAAHNLMLHGLGVGLALALFATSAEAQESVEQGKMLFESRCAVCHQLPEPSMLKLDQWRRSLATLQKRMQTFGMSPLTAVESEQVLAYLATQARD